VDLLRVAIGSILSKESVVIDELKLPALLARSADDNVRGHLNSCKAITDLSLSETLSGWRLAENRAMLLFDEGSLSGSLVGRLSI
jgi:hypothetical protein